MATARRVAFAAAGLLLVARGGGEDEHAEPQYAQWPAPRIPRILEWDAADALPRALDDGPGGGARAPRADTLWLIVVGAPHSAAALQVERAVATVPALLARAARAPAATPAERGRAAACAARLELARLDCAGAALPLCAELGSGPMGVHVYVGDGAVRARGPLGAPPAAAVALRVSLDGAWPEAPLDDPRTLARALLALPAFATARLEVAAGGAGVRAFLEQALATRAHVLVALLGDGGGAAAGAFRGAAWHLHLAHARDAAWAQRCALLELVVAPEASAAPSTEAADDCVAAALRSREPPAAFWLDAASVRARGLCAALELALPAQRRGQASRRSWEAAGLAAWAEQRLRPRAEGERAADALQCRPFSLGAVGAQLGDGRVVVALRVGAAQDASAAQLAAAYTAAAAAAAAGTAAIVEALRARAAASCEAAAAAAAAACAAAPTVACFVHVATRSADGAPAPGWAGWLAPRAQQPAPLPPLDAWDTLAARVGWRDDDGGTAAAAAAAAAAEGAVALLLDGAREASYGARLPADGALGAALGAFGAAALAGERAALLLSEGPLAPAGWAAGAPSGRVVSLSARELERETPLACGALLVYVGASWCGFCQPARAALDGVARALADAPVGLPCGVRVVALDAARNELPRGWAERLLGGMAVASMPALLLLAPATTTGGGSGGADDGAAEPPGPRAHRRPPAAWLYGGVAHDAAEVVEWVEARVGGA